MSIKFEELPFWKKDLINMVSSSFFKGNAIFSFELNLLMVCNEQMFKTFKQSLQLLAKELYLERWLVTYLYSFPNGCQLVEITEFLLSIIIVFEKSLKDFFSVHFLRVQTWVETCLTGIQNIRKCKHTSDLLNTYLHWVQKRSGHLGFQISDFQLKSFVDPKPVEL